MAKQWVRRPRTTYERAYHAHWCAYNNAVLEMIADARGFSNLYPVVPIMNLISMVLCLLLIPGFWKTRVVALITLVVWIFLANLMDFIGMIQWRGNTKDIPILAGFIAIFWRMWMVGCFTSSACFAHITWQRLQPLSMCQLYDTRRRNNRIHFVAGVIVPVLWAPLYLVSCPYRYVIIEDFGPVATVRYDWPGFVTARFPQILSYLVSMLFNTLALVTYWRMKREDIESYLLTHHSSVRTRKLLLWAICQILIAAYGISRSVGCWGTCELVAPRSLAENIASLQTVFRVARSMVEEDSNEVFISRVTTKFAIPLLGFYFFAWFGCGEEARKAYREALMKPVRLMGLAFEEHQPYVGPSPSPWSWIALRRPKLPQGLANSLPFTRTNAPQIVPYISEPSATPADNNPSSPIANVIDIRRQGNAPSRKPERRLSMHKPPPATSHPNAIPSALDIPLRRLSYHKPPFVPLAPPNVPTIATPGASGSTQPRMEGVNSTRRQENFAPRARPRRLSYHKPAFGPANDTSEVANASGPTILLVDAPRDLISDMNARLQVERVLNSAMPPPPFSSSPTATAPPRFSTLFPEPAPPYRKLNPSL